MKKWIKEWLPEAWRLRLHRALFTVRGEFYKGHSVYCNCCEGSFSRFLPYGASRRANAACPKCNSLERHRMLMHFLHHVFAISDQQWKVLDFAPLPSMERQLKSTPSLNYISADINPHLADKEEDIQSLTFNNHTFDLIICSHVLAHVPDEDKALQELRRVLKPDGTLLLLTYYSGHPSTESPDKPGQLGGDQVYRIHGADFPGKVREAGFKVNPRDYLQEVTPAERSRLGMDSGWPEPLLVCTT